MSEPLPDETPIPAATSSYEVCPRCGALVGDPNRHRTYERNLIDFRQRTNDRLAAIAARLGTTTP